MKNGTFIVSFDKSLSEPGVLNCEVSQESILGPVLILLYVNGKKLAVKDCDLRSCFHDTYLIFSNENVISIKKRLNVDFNGLCECFIDNKLYIHLGKDKTKYILFKKGSKQ